ncbi:MAG: quinolinate synthase NadA [Anaerolineae bacterium]
MEATIPVTDSDELLAAAAPLIELAIEEDIGSGDATSLSTLKPGSMLRGLVVAKEKGVIAGLPVVEAVFCQVDPTIKFTAHAADGQEVVDGELVAEVEGPGQSLLAAERTALNFLQRMSGIATQTRLMVDAVATTKVDILDTRKTLPGYRVLDKYAVRMGGGTNHRMGLYDMILIKDNHIDGSGGVTQAIQRARGRFPDLPIEVEVRDLGELQEAMAAKPPLDRILLDNMTLDEMREAVQITGGQVPLEASGNVTLERVGDIAETGIDYISVGSLTHSVPALDLSMKVSPEIESERSAHEAEIREAKAAFGDRLVILGHHYQRDEIIQFADFRGDSLQLSREASQTDAENIVFCGVHFMAEVAAILAKPDQHVVIPDLTAGCYLADTATPEGVSAAWQALDDALSDADEEVTPITYVNSSAALKAFCGRHGGVVCTSGNAERVVAWALTQRPRVFFFPDQHLGRNVALKMGIEPQEMLVWQQRTPPAAETIRSARIILWPGACNVHQRFRPEHVHKVREQYPDIRVIVHPECKAEVVALADESGSTATIVRSIESAEPGTKWAVGTESRLVYRLQKEHPDQTVIPLADVPPFCATMSQITLANLAETLSALREGKRPNEVTVEPQTARWAKIALDRMLAL